MAGVGDVASVVERARDGDPDALRILVDRFQSMAFATAYGYLGSSVDAEDAAQEAFAVLPSLLPQLREPAAFPGWFRQVVRTAAVRQGRRVARSVGDPGPGQVVADVAEVSADRETALAVRRAVEALPPPHRTVIALQYIAGLAQADIAGLLGVPVSTVKKRVFDARQRLRAAGVEEMRTAIRQVRAVDRRRFTDVVMLFRAVKTGDLAAADRILRRSRDLVDAEEAWDSDAAHAAGLPPAGHGTALIRAAENDDTAMIDLLISHGAVVDGACGCATAESALWAATVSGRLAAVRTLLGHGADPNRATGRGVTPLHAARIRGHDDIAALLAAAGADQRARDAAGRIPSDWATLPPDPVKQGGGRLLLTGIAAVDLFATVPVGGTVRIGGPPGVGQIVLLTEITRRVAVPTLWTGFPDGNVDEHRIAHAAAEAGVSVWTRTLLAEGADEPGRRGQFEAIVATLTHRQPDPVIVVLVDQPGHHHDVTAALPRLTASPGVMAVFVLSISLDEVGEVHDEFDSHITMTRERMIAGILPAIDPATSTTRAPVSPEHRRIAEAARARIATHDTHTDAKALNRLLRQPFFTAEPFTALPASHDAELPTLLYAVRQAIH